VQVEQDRIEVLRLKDGRLAVRRYQLGLLREATYLAQSELLAWLAAWPGLSVLLHRSAAPLAAQLRAAGRMVWGG
jgi:hypothetical protein